MAWPKSIVLVRHAESEGNVLSVDGRANYDLATWAYKLTPRGRQQAEITGRFLRGFYGSFDVRYVSYYTRSRETMDIILPDMRVYEDPRLAEAQRGVWHTMTRQEIEMAYPHEVRRRDREGLYHYRPLGGENWPDVELRIHSFLGTLSRDCEGKSVLIVCHGHWLILFQRLIEHFSIDEALRRYQNKVCENASITEYVGEVIDGCPRLRPVTQNFIPWLGEV